MYTTTDKSRVSVPNWADDYRVGDEIHYQHPHTGEPECSLVIGFSTKPSNEGLPVIETPDSFDKPELENVAITEEYHLESIKVPQ